MTVYPVSLSTTAVLVGIALLICHPARQHLKAGAKNLLDNPAGIWYFYEYKALTERVSGDSCVSESGPQAVRSAHGSGAVASELLP